MSDNKQNRSEIVEFLMNKQSEIEKHLMNRIGYDTFNFLDSYQQSLLITSKILVDLIKKYPQSLSEESKINVVNYAIIKDFSFLVLPAAKAFEGYLKKLLMQLELITLDKLRDDPFNIRIGKKLNSDDFTKKLRDKKRFKAIPKLISSQWDLCRNEILHYDPFRPIELNLDEAILKIENIYNSIKTSYEAFIEHPDATIERKFIAEAINKVKKKLSNNGK